MSERDISKTAILHIMDSAYCFPVSRDEMVIRIRTAKNDIKNAEIIYESKYVFGTHQNHKKMTKIFTDGLYDFFSVHLKLKDTRLAYVFYLTDRDGSYFFSEDGITKEYTYELGYYNFFQYPYINSADIHRKVKWMENATVYQIFVERFNMGNDQKEKGYINLNWGDIPNAKSFAGGDLNGITQKLDYLKELGINTIYLTPVFKSISNHKYDISDYKTVDPQFGGNEALLKLTNEAHAREIKIILDAVFNHCSDEAVQFQDVVEKGHQSPFHDWFIIDGEKPDPVSGNYETFASCKYMPKFNTSNLEVQKYLIDIACYWMREYHIDGWRLDVSDEVSHDFWRNFRREVKKMKEDIVIIGENWHDASNYLRGDQYDSIMNYAFTKACLDYFAYGKADAQGFSDKLSSILMRNTDTANQMMLNLLDSHDTYRFIYEVKGNVNKLLAAIQVMMLFPGSPCIYYGTEIGLTGGYDPDSRRCMNWTQADESSKNGKIYHCIQRMARLRKSIGISGMNTKIGVESKLFVIRRKSEDHSVVLYVNNTEEPVRCKGMTIEPFGTVLLVDNEKM